MLSIHDALTVARFLWPRFVERDRAVLLESSDGTTVGSFPSLTEAEILLNHCHVLDLVAHQAGLDDAPFWDSAHPDFRAACELGRLAAHTWATKLAEDFPGRRFRVYFTRDDNPIVRFHQLREGEPPYMDIGDSPSDAVVIHDVG